MMTFKTDGMRALWEEVGDLSHPDYPFLDRNYSPSSCMPVCDLTPYVADFILQNDWAALNELWSYIGRSDKTINPSILADIPDGLGLTEYARAELCAAYLLTSRISHDNGVAFVGGDVVSTILSTRDVDVDSACSAHWQSFLRCELEDMKSRDWPELDIEEKVNDSWTALLQGTDRCENFANFMKGIPPMVRITFADAIRSAQSNPPYDSLYNKHLHFGNGYGHRVYGCSETIGRAYAQALDILRHPCVEEIGITSKVTKSVLLQALTAHGINPPKNTKRENLIRLAEDVPGLLQHIQDQCEPDLLVIRSDLQAESKVWADRTKRLIWLSSSLLAYMGEMELFPGTKRLIPATCKDVIRTHANIYSSISNVNTQNEYTVWTVPAWELIRHGQRRVPRDWPARWKSAGDAVGWVGASRDFGRMVALKDSPIWQALGNGVGGYDDALGNPYPPFAIGSGMNWLGVDRRDCIKMGLIGERDQPGVPVKVGYGAVQGGNHIVG